MKDIVPGNSRHDHESWRLCKNLLTWIIHLRTWSSTGFTTSKCCCNEHTNKHVFATIRISNGNTEHFQLGTLTTQILTLGQQHKKSNINKHQYRNSACVNAQPAHAQILPDNNQVFRARFQFQQWVDAMAMRGGSSERLVVRSSRRRGDARARLTKYITVMLAALLSGGGSALLFLVPLYADPALSALAADFDPIPAECVTERRDDRLGLDNCTWASCREGGLKCFFLDFSCIRIVACIFLILGVTSTGPELLLP